MLGILEVGVQTLILRKLNICGYYVLLLLYLRLLQYTVLSYRNHLLSLFRRHFRRDAVSLITISFQLAKFPKASLSTEILLEAAKIVKNTWVTENGCFPRPVLTLRHRNPKILFYEWQTIQQYTSSQQHGLFFIDSSKHYSLTRLASGNLVIAYYAFSDQSGTRLRHTQQISQMYLHIR